MADLVEKKPFLRDPSWSADMALHSPATAPRSSKGSPFAQRKTSYGIDLPDLSGTGSAPSPKPRLSGYTPPGLASGSARERRRASAPYSAPGVPKLQRSEDQYPDIGSRLGTALRGVVSSQASQFNDMAKLDTKLKAPLARVAQAGGNRAAGFGQSVSSNVANFGRTLMGAEPVRPTATPAPAASTPGSGAGSSPTLTADAPPAAAVAPPAAAVAPAGPASPARPQPALLPPVQARTPVQTGRHGEPVYNNETLARLGMTPDADRTAGARTSSPTPTPPRLQLPQQIFAAQSTAAEVQGATQRALAGQRSAASDTRADAARFLNPMSEDAEIMRRFEISQGYGSNKGSPQARRMAGEAILGQLGARNEASAVRQQGAGAVLQQGALAEGQAAEAAAQRQLEAAQSNQVAQREEAQRLSEDRRLYGDPIRDVTGRTSILRNDGTAAFLRDEEGAPIVTPAPASRIDTVSADTQYRALADQLMKLQEAPRPPEGPLAIDYDQRLAELRLQMNQLTGADQPPAPPGMTLVGTKDGHRIYRDASGQLHIDE